MSRSAKGNLPGDPGKPTGSVPTPRLIGEGFPPTVQPHHRWLPFMVCFFLSLAVWAVFGQTLHCHFINYDDNLYVYDNSAISQGFSLHGVAWAFTHVNDPGEWLPLSALSRMLDCQLYGLHPGGHHLTNLLLHA